MEEAAADWPERVTGPEATILAERLAELGEPMSLFGPVKRTQRSSIYFGETQRYPTPLAVKLCLQDGNVTPAEAAQGAYESLQRLAAISTDSHGLFAPACYALLPSLGVLVSEWVPGCTLHALIARSDARTILRIATLAGAWLGSLACHTKTGRSPIASRLMLAQFEDVRLQASERRSLELLRKTADISERDPVTWFPSFGDFKPENLLLHKGKIYGIDAALNQPDSVVVDAAHFLNHVLLQTPLPLFAPGSTMWDTRLVAAFCEGYGRSDPGGLALVPLQWARLRSALRLSVSHRDWSRPPRAWITGALIGRLNRLLASRLAAATEDLF